MIEKWLEQLAGFIVDAFCKKMGIETLDDLTKAVAAAVKNDLPDIEGLPGQVVAAVVAGIRGLIPIPFGGKR